MKKYIILLTSVTLNLICIFLYLITNNINILFALLWIITIVIIYVSRFSFFSTISFLISYISIPIFYQYNFNKSYGMLELNHIPFYPKEMYVCIIGCLNILLFFTLFTKILEREKSIYLYDYKFSDLMFNISCIGTIVFAFVAFPRLPFLSTNGNRFDMLLPGKSWNHLSIVFLIITSTRLKTSRMAKICCTFTVFWFLSHGERVDMTGYFLGMGLFYLNRNKVTLKTKVMFVILGFSAFFLLTIIGNIRNSFSLSADTIFYNVLVQKTSADLSYVFNSSIHYYYNYDLYHGMTYTSYLYNFIPLLDAPYLPETILKDLFLTAGGEYIYCEPIINFGIYGLFVFEIIELMLLNFAFRIAKNKYFMYVLAFMFFAQFRLIWYGRSYLETSFVIFIPFLMLLEYCIMYPKRNMTYIDYNIKGSRQSIK